ncbi:MAG: sigma-70 family RNA polymerase sigma factor [Verrucomicrobiota bacterium]
MYRWMMNDDMALVRAYAASQSERAFEQLAARHLNMIYSAAMRRVGDAHLAEEIFIILARKAGSLGPKTILSGWLYRTTSYAAADALKMQRRRQQREQEAHMQSLLNEQQPDEAWQQIAPLLDSAMDALGDKDRNAVVLRFLDGKSLSEVGATLGVSEDAAKMRVNRALEKLRKIFTKRGVMLSVVAIAGVVSANSVQAAPVGFAMTVTAVAAKGTIISATLTTLVKGTMKTMTWLKVKFAIGAGAVALLVGGAATVALSENKAPIKGTASNPAAHSQPQILIESLFVRTATKNVDAILKEFAKPEIPTDPTSKEFRALIQKHPGVSVLGSPKIITTSSMQGTMSITREVKINGTNAETGIVVEVTPEIQRDFKIALTIHTELRELIDGASPPIRTTKQKAQTLLVKSNVTAMVRTRIGEEGESLGKLKGEPEETLLVFVNAVLVNERLEKIIKR